MDKIKLEFKAPEIKRTIYKGNEIQVFPFLSLPKQGFLINSYLREYLTPKENRLIEFSKYNYLEAEFSLINYIYDLNTNIEAKDIDLDVVADVELWNIVKKEITNFEDFRNKLDYIVKQLREDIALGASVGSVLDSLVEKGVSILEKFSELTPETINMAKETGLQLMEKLEESSILGESKPVKRGRKKTQ